MFKNLDSLCDLILDRRPKPLEVRVGEDGGLVITDMASERMVGKSRYWCAC